MKVGGQTFGAGSGLEEMEVRGEGEAVGGGCRCGGEGLLRARRRGQKEARRRRAPTHQAVFPLESRHRHPPHSAPCKPTRPASPRAICPSSTAPLHPPPPARHSCTSTRRPAPSRPSHPQSYRHCDWRHRSRAPSVAERRVWGAGCGCGVRRGGRGRRCSDGRRGLRRCVRGGRCLRCGAEGETMSKEMR